MFSFFQGFFYMSLLFFLLDILECYPSVGFVTLFHDHNWKFCLLSKNILDFHPPFFSIWKSFLFKRFPYTRT